jgi:hypothetical protein
MKAFNNLRTGVRLFGGFTLITLLLLFVAFVGYATIKAMNEDLTSMLPDRVIAHECINPSPRRRPLHP